MSSNRSTASPTTSTEPPSTPSNLREESPAPHALRLEPMMEIPLPTFPLGVNPSNLVLQPSVLALSPSPATPSATTSISLRSSVKPHELLESLPLVEPRILRVSNEDIQALCQVITEFKEQFVNL